MRPKITYNAKTAYSGSDIKREVTEDEAPVRKRARTNRQDSSSDTTSMDLTPETPAKKRKITNKRKKAKESENDSSSGTISKGILSGIPLGAPSMYLERNESPSLWITLPRANKSELLNFVLEDELIRILPERFKVFLVGWLSSAQQKIIKMLQRDGLRRVIKSVNVKRHESMKRSDERLRLFLKKVLPTVFNTQRFPIFGRKSKWLIFISSFVKNRSLKDEIDETVLTKVFTSLDKKDIKKMSPFLTGSKQNKLKEVKVYYCHMLRFALKFAFNTLRHVFKFEPQNFTFLYCGELEKPNSEKVAEERLVEPQTVPIPTTVTCSSTSGTISTDLISAISFGVPAMYLERNESPSLWITLPQADQSHLLELVVEDELIKDLSKRGKRFLTDWLLSVQQKMIQMLKNDDLRKIIESVEIGAHRFINRSENNVYIFLQEVLKTIFQTEQFAIFEECEDGRRYWLSYIRKLVQKKSLTERPYDSVLKLVSTQLNRKAKTEFSSSFRGSTTQRYKKAENYYPHILRFVLKFAFNTLRHVFKFERRNCSYFYDGELEEGGISYQTSDWENVAEEHDVEPQVVPFPTPATCSSTSGTISMDLISVIPFGVPSMYLERNQYPSLWITLPQAKQSNLLEFVLENELIDVTPEPFKAFLTDWLLSVQQQMIQFLKDDGLRKVALVKVQAPKTLDRCDDGRPYILVERTLNAVFQTKQFPIFEGGRVWIKFIKHFIRTGPLAQPFDEETEMELTSTKINKNARIAVSSFFRETDETKESKEQRKQRYKTEQIYYYRILRFALKFALNTLRHVFKFDSENSTFFYDGELEEGGISHQTSDWEQVAEERDVKPQVVPFPTPTTNGSTSSTITKDPTTTVPFGSSSMHVEQVAEEHDVKPQVVPFTTPVTYDSSFGTNSMNPAPAISFGAPSVQVAEEQDIKPQLPLAVPLAAPVQKPQGHLPPKEVVPTVPPSNDPSSSNIGDKMSQYMQFFDSSLVPQKWLNAFKMVVQHNEYLKSQEARLEARYKELKAEVQELKEEKRRRMI